MLRYSRKRRKNQQRGASLLEAAFVAPAFFLIIFGIIEFGFLFRNYLTISSATTDAARTASIRGNDSDADFQTIQTFRQGFEVWDLQDFDYIVIFEADGPGAQVPDSCKGPTGASNAADKCNRYEVADLFKPVEDGGDINFGDCTGDPVADLGAGKISLDMAWCPLIRDSDLGGTGADAGVDLIGVYVEATHEYITGFFMDSSTLAYTQVVRMEPSRS